MSEETTKLPTTDKGVYRLTDDTVSLLKALVGDYTKRMRLDIRRHNDQSDALYISPTGLMKLEVAIEEGDAALAELDKQA